MANKSAFKTEDVQVDVILREGHGSKVAYGVVGFSRPFRALHLSTSPYLGHGKSVWRVAGDFTGVERRVIGMALKKADNDEKNSVNLWKKYKAPGYYGGKTVEYADVTLPGRKAPK